MSCQPHKVPSGQSNSGHKQIHISKLFSHIYQPPVKSNYKTNHFPNIKHIVRKKDFLLIQKRFPASMSREKTEYSSQDVPQQSTAWQRLIRAGSIQSHSLTQSFYATLLIITKDYHQRLLKSIKMHTAVTWIRSPYFKLCYVMPSRADCTSLLHVWFP